MARKRKPQPGKRLITVEIDEEELSWAAEEAKEDIPRFIALAVVDAMCVGMDPGEQRMVCVAVDGEPFVIVHSEGESDEECFREVWEAPR